MHVLICSYEFDLGAEGICTGRLTRALLEAGCQVTVVTSPEARTTFQHERLCYRVVSPTPLRPAKFFFRLAPLLGHIPTRHGYIWSRRVAGLSFAQPPDIVYGRAQPFQSVAAAHGLAARCRVPLWAHFSDPLPSPWLDQNCFEYAQTRRGVRRVAREAQILTLTTQEALLHQETMLGERLSGKSLVLNHIAPPPAFLPGPRANAGKNFAYLGLFYGKRNASALLQGFRQHVSRQPQDKLLFVGTEPQSVLLEAARLGIQDAVHVRARVDNVREVMAEADVLVATDAFSGPPVFLSTKLVEYLVVNRPVLLISPEQSPGSKLVSRFPTSTVRVPTEEATAVAAGLAESAACTPDKSAYLQRFSALDCFSAKAVAECFLKEALARNPSKPAVSALERQPT